MWIVFAALILYNTAVLSGRFDAFRRWVLDHLPNDKRIVLIVIGYGFGSLLEGVSGFGAPVAITASLLIMLGFKPIDAVVYALIFNTAPVAFGSLGIPITTLAGVTGLPAAHPGRDGRPPTALLRPAAALLCHRHVWRHALGQGAVAGAAGRRRRLRHRASSSPPTIMSYELTDVVSAGSSLIATVLFLRVWQPAPDPEFALVVPARRSQLGRIATCPRRGRAGCPG